jgi:hypothetical protein
MITVGVEIEWSLEVSLGLAIRLMASDIDWRCLVSKSWVNRHFQMHEQTAMFCYGFLVCMFGV